MKRFHLHLAVRSLEESVDFYSALFGHPPTKRREDYAKWQLDDPPMNFALSPAARSPGVDHIGLQFDTADALGEATRAWQQRRLAVSKPAAATCCYAHSEKSWLYDPQGLAWEAFATHGDSESYGAGESVQKSGKAACCGPQSQESAPQ